MGGWYRWALVSPDGVMPSRVVSVSAAVNLSLHRKVENRVGNGSMGHGSWVKWVTKIGWVTWVMGH